VSESSNRTDTEIEQLVQSQQFQQRLQLLNAALQQDKLASLVDALESEKGNIYNGIKQLRMQRC
jgi:hypothetical protein